MRSLRPHALTALVAVACFMLAGPPVALAQTPQVATGKAVYDQNCANCHGPNGTGGVPNPGASSASKKQIPGLTGTSFTSRFPTAESVKKIVESGSTVPGRRDVISMPAWKGVLTEAQIDDVVAYVISLQQTGIGAGKLAAVAGIWILVLLTSLLLYLRLGQVESTRSHA